MSIGTSAIEFEILCDGLEYPEGPVALADGSVIVVEVAGGRLTRVFPNGRKATVAETGGGPNGAAVGPDGCLYVCNNGGVNVVRDGNTIRIFGQPESYSGGRIERVDIRSGKVEEVYRSCDGHALRAPNDIVFDAHGGFYFTDLGKTRARDRDRGGVYYALPDGSHIREVIYPISMPNGIGLSADGRSLYVAETETARLWQFDIVSPGMIEKRPLPSPNGGFCVFGAGGFQNFDSLKLDAGGRICIATLENGGITVVDPEGTAGHTPLPESHVTNLCFGGADNRSAFVTMGSSGRIAVLRWDRPGLKLHFNECLPI